MTFISRNGKTPTVPLWSDVYWSSRQPEMMTTAIAGLRSCRRLLVGWSSDLGPPGAFDLERLARPERPEAAQKGINSCDRPDVLTFPLTRRRSGVMNYQDSCGGAERAICSCSRADPALELLISWGGGGRREGSRRDGPDMGLTSGAPQGMHGPVTV